MKEMADDCFVTLVGPRSACGRLGFGAMSPAQAQSQIWSRAGGRGRCGLRGSTPYYRQGDYRYDDRLLQRDRYAGPCTTLGAAQPVLRQQRNNGYNNNGYYND